MIKLSLPKLIVFSFLLIFPNLVHANELNADVDRGEISQDESVQLKITSTIEGRGSTSDPQFDAPEFEIVNQFRSSYIESTYINGKFGMKNNQTFTFVLRPLKTGALTIKNITAEINGSKTTAPSITVQVHPSGSGSAPHSGYRSGLGLRGSGSKLVGRDFFVKAEVNKTQIYKGEQLIVSYWLYRRTPVYNLQVEKYPSMSGFLREELEMPVLQPRLESESVVLEGTRYERALLVRYAAYPIKEGKLEIDSMGAKLSYLNRRLPSNGLGLSDDEDPFQNFFSQFQNMGQTISGHTKSDPIRIEVLPLPNENQPENFNGAVGQFTIAANLPSSDISEGEAFSYQIKIQGRGNLASLDQYKVNWSEGIRQYDVQNKTKSTKSAISTREFEFLLIPEKTGPITLPSLSFSYFDPEQKRYLTATSDPITVQVGPSKGGKSKTSTSTPDSSDFRKGGDRFTDRLILQVRQILKQLEVVALWILTGMILLIVAVALKAPLQKLSMRLKQKRTEKANLKKAALTRLEKEVQKAQKDPSWENLNRAYEAISQSILEILEAQFKIPTKGVSRSELKRKLTLKDDQWALIDPVLEYAERVRFGASAGAVTQAEAKESLEKSLEAVNRLKHTFA